LVFWLAAGTVAVNWYDRKRFYRMDPDVLAYVSHSVQDYKARQATPAAGDSGARQRPSGEDRPSRPNAPDQG
jgi:hypothetical protein